MSGILMGALRGFGKGLSENAKFQMEHEGKINTARELAKIEDEIRAGREQAILDRRAKIMGQAGGNAEEIERQGILAGDTALTGYGGVLQDRAAKTERQAIDDKRYDEDFALKKTEHDLRAANLRREGATASHAATDRARAEATNRYKSLRSMGKTQEAESYRQEVFNKTGIDPAMGSKNETASNFREIQVFAELARRYEKADIGGTVLNPELREEYERAFSEAAELLRQGVDPHTIPEEAQRRARSGGGKGDSTVTSVSSQEEYAQLPSGARFRAPDGTIRIKP